MYESLIAHFIYASESEHINCLLIKGSSHCFSAGNDFTESVNGDQLPAFKFIDQLATFKKPLIAAVAGPAVGIGITMLLQCDMVIAATNSQFSLPFTKLGICLEAGASLLLPLKIGHNRAFELSVLGEAFNAEQAHQYGIVNKVCQPTDLIETAASVALDIAKLPTDSVQTSKKLMRQSTDINMLDVLENEKNEVMRLLKSDYCQSIMKKFGQ
jgi:enoyl-CoA hydratase/carnithine racemase